MVTGVTSAWVTKEQALLEHDVIVAIVVLNDVTKSVSLPCGEQELLHDEIVDKSVMTVVLVAGLFELADEQIPFKHELVKTVETDVTDVVVPVKALEDKLEDIPEEDPGLPVVRFVYWVEGFRGELTLVNVRLQGEDDVLTGATLEVIEREVSSELVEANPELEIVVIGKIEVEVDPEKVELVLALVLELEIELELEAELELETERELELKD